jgi:general secretion pathway protein D
VRGGFAFLCLGAILAALAGCDTISNGQNTSSNKPDVFDYVRSVDLAPRTPETAQVGVASGGRAPRAASYYGEAPAVQGAAPASSGGDGYELNFDNAPVTTVAKVILGDILGSGYTIDPRVQGTVSLASGQPVQKSDLLFVLESALRLSNVAMVKDTAGYRLLPLSEAVGSGRIDRGRPEPGFGISVVPLRYVNVATAIKLFDNFATKPGMVRGDAARNILIFQGTAAERATAVETVLTFDVDWMRGQSVGIYPIHNATPDPLIAELEKIMGAAEGGPAQSLVKFQSVARLNAIMVVSSRPELLRTAATWISRLDKTDTASSGVKVYRVKYGDAKQLAGLLNDIFTGQSGGGGLDSPVNQIAPGGGLSVSSSGQGLGGGGLGGTTSLSGARPSSAGGTAAAATETRVGETGFGGPTPGRGRLGSSVYAPAGGASNFGGGGGGGPAILPGVRITADVANNSLLIYSNQENYRIIEQTLYQLDRPQLQVSIDATIAEITLNDSLKYGVQYFIQSKDIGAKPDSGSVDLVNSATSAVLNRALPGFNFLLGSEANPRIILDALRSVSDVKVLSAPSVVVLDNQVATLQVGDQIPVTTQSATSVIAPGAPIVNNIDYRNTGVILRVVPRINVNGNVLLDIEQEISNVAATPNANTLTPTVSQRKVKSSIAVATGQTVLLAGLISERQERNRAGIPILEQFDWLGDAFSHQDSSTQRTELIIFIRPQIIRDGVDARRVAEELRSKLRGSVESSRAPLIQMPNKRPAPILQ